MACYCFALGSRESGFVVVRRNIECYAPAEDVQAVDDWGESYRGCDGASEMVRLVFVVETEDECYHGRRDGCEQVQLICQSDCHTDLVCYTGFGTEHFA